MTTEAKVILDSVAPNGERLTTFELTYPRFIHAELMTHRVYSRNAASSRAIPTRDKVARIRADCARPSEWGRNQKGMQSGGPLPEEEQLLAAKHWNFAMHDALFWAEMMSGLRCRKCGSTTNGEGAIHDVCDHEYYSLHKQVANRIMEPFDHITVVLSGTSFRNLFSLRDHPMADPTFQELARKWKAAYEASVPTLTKVGEWHLPYVHVDVNGVRSVTEDDGRAFIAYDGCRDFNLIARKVSAGRCARVSYMRQGQGDVEENVKLHDRLVGNQPIHASPVEHQATPIDYECGVACYHSSCCYCLGVIPRGAKWFWINGEGWICHRCAQGHVTSGNFTGWMQYRKLIPGESGE